MAKFIKVTQDGKPCIVNIKKIHNITNGVSAKTKKKCSFIELDGWNYCGSGGTSKDSRYRECIDQVTESVDEIYDKIYVAQTGRLRRALFKGKPIDELSSTEMDELKAFLCSIGGAPVKDTPPEELL